ncbi:MAG: hypothetical protein HXY23_15380, partial [Parvularculaceae bacterium]|nr:hypothetical protein [Parvularculaceae bacterium]
RDAAGRAAALVRTALGAALFFDGALRAIFARFLAVFLAAAFFAAGFAVRRRAARLGFLALRVIAQA